jgi:cation:H+ antiporter
MPEHVALFAAGLVVLVAGAETLVRGAVRVARALGVSQFLVGFTLVAFGTSAPELAVSLSAALEGRPGIAVGNVVGSNIANIGLVLGAAALVRPLAGSMRLLRVEVPLVIVATLLFWFLCRDNTLSRGDGVALLVGFAALCVFIYRGTRAEPAGVKEEVGKAAAVHMPVWLAAVLVVVGLAGLAGGAHLMVESAVEIAKALGVNQWVIGLTVVALGTSLPELAAALVAAYRDQPDLVLGNVAGSNLFNILFVLGVTLTARPVMGVSDRAVMNEIPAMALFSFLLFATIANGLRVHRWEGAILLLAYAAFLTWQMAAR